MSCVALSCDILCCPIGKKQNMSIVKDNQDSFSFVDKTGPTVTTDVKTNAKWNMEGSS